jgi:hypothetical protein
MRAPPLHGGRKLPTIESPPIDQGDDFDEEPPPTPSSPRLETPDIVSSVPDLKFRRIPRVSADCDEEEEADLRSLPDPEPVGASGTTQRVAKKYARKGGKLYKWMQYALHEPERRIKCLWPECDVTFYGYHDGAEHIRWHIWQRGDDFQCPFCDASPRTGRDLERHLTTKGHMKVALVCKFCLAECSRPDSLIRHCEARHVGLRESSETPHA